MFGGTGYGYPNNGDIQGVVGWIFESGGEWIINFHFGYEEILLWGSLNEDTGYFSGNAENISGGEKFTWEMVSGEVYQFENHGQLVASQKDKQEAAQSEIGMPIQSE